jgi:pimeloyl-ACP methyl ester carboxylesterase
MYENNPRFDEYTRLYEEQTVYKGFQHSLLSMLRNDAVRNYDNAYDIVGKQKRDILLIWGTDDTEITQEMINGIRSFIPHIKFIAVESAGHGILFQESEKVNDLILRFLLAISKSGA